MKYKFDKDQILRCDGKVLATFAEDIDFDWKDAVVHDLNSGQKVNNPPETKSGE